MAKRRKKRHKKKSATLDENASKDPMDKTSSCLSKELSSEESPSKDESIEKDQSLTEILVAQPDLQYAYRIDVDNHLGSLYIRLSHKFVPEISVPLLNMSNKIHICSDFIHVKAAKYFRSFVQLIPFDINIPRLNDTDNQPRSAVYKDICEGNGKDVIVKYQRTVYEQTEEIMKTDAQQWIWENYRPGIWRVVPLSTESFINSPVYDLLNIILWKIHTMITNQFGEQLYVGTVVLQRSPRDSFIGRHTDNCGSRRISFIYYLTPDDWSEEDGGELILEEKETERKIIPRFNQLVMWKLGTSQTSDSELIYHRVNPVKSTDDRPRLALVGFFDQPTK
ncbi:2OG-Fe(II) oxygenase superfamily protein [uncultured virus]|nr:2OG-Fe(II) oxygenase superfamily protein [uncultured virus]